jgi:exodeoxyribonuclease VII large subunit
MPEHIHDKEVFSLLEVTRSIRGTLAKRYGSAFWVRAEMIKLNHYPHSGHCYPDLVEKKDGKVIAQIRANLWESDYRRINDQFLDILQEPLKDGIKILLMAKITFDPVYGLALQILDIDPGYTLGDLEMERQQTLLRLRREGIFDKNSGLPWPLLPQRIAVISVETSKGYADFLRVTDNNIWGYRFFQLLFPALLQGERAVDSIIGQLKRIRRVRHHFDVVAIIRGGGGDVGLSCYNDYRLSREIALFPLPVLTGIGHATNETVAEMVAFQNAITPTKMAEYLIQRFHDFSVPVQRAQEKITDRARRLIREQNVQLNTTTRYFRSVTTGRLHQSSDRLQRQSASLIRGSGFLLQQAGRTQGDLLTRARKATVVLCSQAKKETDMLGIMLKKEVSVFQQHQQVLLAGMEKNIANLDPKNVLRRGYSITLINHKAITRPGQIKEGEVITTMLSEGSLTSEIKSIQKPAS